MSNRQGVAMMEDMTMTRMGAGMMAVMCLALWAASAAEPAARTRPAASAESPLAALPSAPGAHVAKLEALGDNRWINLGQAAADPKWGLARGRSWCSKMAAAPDLGGAFFCGTGVHGATPEGRYMDDLWFYDARAHRWICLYPGADPKTLKLHLDEDGFEVNDAGEHIPVSYLSHAYNNTTYNTDLRQYHIMWTQCPWWTKALPQRWKWLDQSHKGVAERDYGAVGPIIGTPKHPLTWDVATGKWRRRLVKGAGPKGRFEGVTEYIPSLKKTLYTHRGTTWFYDYATNAWSAGAAKVPASVASYDSNGCFDRRNERIYVARIKGFACYDVKTRKWREIKAEGQPENLGNTNGAQMNFDCANGVVVWHKSHGPIVVYDPRTDKWTDMGNTCPKIPWKRYNVNYMCTHAFYDPGLNVHFFYLAGDSKLNDATMLAYRYKRVKTDKTEE